MVFVKPVELWHFSFSFFAMNNPHAKFIWHELLHLVIHFMRLDLVTT